MPKKSEVGIVDILRYNKQIELMKRIIDDILEPTEEEKKYKEKYGKQMDFPKSFQDKDGKTVTWDAYEQRFRVLSNDLGVLEKYYKEPQNVSMEECKKSWDDFVLVIDKFFDNIQQQVHEKYAIGNGEFDALTNPRARRMVKIADAVTDIAGLKNALYEREKVNKIQEKAFAVNVEKKNYLNAKKEFANNYVGETIEKDRYTVMDQKEAIQALQERNKKLNAWLVKTEGYVAESKKSLLSKSEKMLELSKKKLEFDNERDNKLKDLSTMIAYVDSRELEKQIEIEKEQIENLKHERQTLEEMQNEYRAEIRRALNELISRNEEVVFKYMGMDNETQILETLIQDEEMQKKYPQVTEAALSELAISKANGNRSVDRDVLIEKHEEKLSKLQEKLEKCQNTIKKNNRPYLEKATASDVRRAKIEMEEFDKSFETQNLKEKLEDIESDINNSNEYISTQEKKMKTARKEIENNIRTLDETIKSLEENEKTVDKVSRAVAFHGRLQQKKTDFVDAMQKFKSGRKASTRIIDKSKSFNLDEGTRFMHKNTQEFNKMKNALEKVQNCDPNNRKELRSKLKELETAAREYKEKKLKDGGFNTGMRQTRLTKAQSLINMCELGIQELSAVPEKKEKALLDFKEKMEKSIQKKTEQNVKDKRPEVWKLEEKLEHAREKKDVYESKIQREQVRMEELEEVFKDNEDFSL